MVVANPVAAAYEPVLSRLTEGSLVDYPPVISQDTAYIFVGSVSGDILIFSSKTAAPLGALEGCGPLIGFDVVRNSLAPHLVAAYRTEDPYKLAHLRIWNYETAEIINEIPVTFRTGCRAVGGFFCLWASQARFFLALPSRKSLPNTIAGEGVPDHQLKEIHGFNWVESSSDGVGMALGAVAEHIRPDPRAFAGNAVLNYFACVGGDKIFFKSYSKDLRRSHKISGRVEPLCVAAHPYSETVAVGDADGRITVIRGIFNNSPIKSEFHWHSNPLYCVRFSSEGGHLLSGGKESCVVKQVLDAKAREFISWMEGPIVQLAYAPDDSFAVTAHADNGIRLITPQREVKAVIQGLSRNYTQGEEADPYSIGLVRDPGGKGIVLNGMPGHIQFCSLDPFKFRHNFDVSTQIYATDDKNKVVAPTHVTHVRFSEPDSKWMATVERRNDGVHAVELRLKFWRFRPKHGNYALNVSVELPDSAASVTGMEFQRARTGSPMLMAVTAEDKKIRIFLENRVDLDDVDGEVDSWTCIQNTSFEGLVPRNLALSYDGSVLGVIYDDLLTLWNMDPLTLRSRVKWPSDGVDDEDGDYVDDRLRHVAFGRFAAERSVVLASDSKVMVWSLLDLRATWYAALKVQHLFSDPGSAHFGVVTRENRIYIFKPTNSSCVLMADITRLSFERSMVNPGGIMGAAFVASPPSNDSFVNFAGISGSPPNDVVVLTSAHDVRRLSFVRNRRKVESKAGMKKEKRKPLMAPVAEASTPFARLVAEKMAAAPAQTSTIGQTSGRDAVAGRKTSDFLNKFLYLPSHSLPSMSSLCKGFVSAYLSDVTPQTKATAKKAKPVAPRLPVVDEKAAASDSEDETTPSVQSSASAATITSGYGSDLEREGDAEEGSDSEYDDVRMANFGFLKDANAFRRAVLKS